MNKQEPPIKSAPTEPVRKVPLVSGSYLTRRSRRKLSVQKSELSVSQTVAVKGEK